MTTTPTTTPTPAKLPPVNANMNPINGIYTGNGGGFSVPGYGGYGQTPLSDSILPDPNSRIWQQLTPEQQAQLLAMVGTQPVGSGVTPPPPAGGTVPPPPGPVGTGAPPPAPGTPGGSLGAVGGGPGSGGNGIGGTGNGAPAGMPSTGGMLGGQVPGVNSGQGGASPSNAGGLGIADMISSIFGGGSGSGGQSSANGHGSDLSSLLPDMSTSDILSLLSYAPGLAGTLGTLGGMGYGAYEGATGENGLPTTGGLAGSGVSQRLAEWLAQQTNPDAGIHGNPSAPFSSVFNSGILGMLLGNHRGGSSQITQSPSELALTGMAGVTPGLSNLVNMGTPSLGGVGQSGPMNVYQQLAASGYPGGNDQNAMRQAYNSAIDQANNMITTNGGTQAVTMGSAGGSNGGTLNYSGGDFQNPLGLSFDFAGKALQGT